MKLVVTSREEITTDTIRLTLAHPDGLPLPDWTAGAHVDVGTPAGVRQYSLCGETSDSTSWSIAVLREPASRGGSVHLHEQAGVGTTLDVAGPRNNFALRPAERYVFVGGGIGITPLVPMAAAADAAGIPFDLHLGGRSAATIPFAASLTQRLGDRFRSYPQDSVGMLPLGEILRDVGPGTGVYCCGPPGLIAAVRELVSPESGASCHVEQFVAEADKRPRGAFDVELARSGLRLRVPADRSILEVLTEANIFVPSSCEEGTCGSCEVMVLAGRPEHRDALTDLEADDADDAMMVCVSRASSDLLVLDV
jgi:ferredoxin-NADP reductase